MRRIVEGLQRVLVLFHAARVRFQKERVARREIAAQSGLLRELNVYDVFKFALRRNEHALEARRALELRVDAYRKRDGNEYDEREQGAEEEHLAFVRRIRGDAQIRTGE